MTTVLVIGASGNVGRHVVRELDDRGVEVRAFVRDVKRAADVLGSEVEPAVGDLSEPSSIRRALVGVDAMFLACANHPEQVTFETNAIDAAVAAGIGRIAKLSAFGAEIGSPLGFWDAQGRIEQHLIGSGLPSTLLRPAMYMSNLFASTETIRHAGAIVAPAGEAKIAMVDPRDVAAVAAAVLVGGDHAGMSYTLTGPEPITFAQVALQLSAVLDREIVFVDVPDEAARDALLQAGTPAWLADNLVTLFSLVRQGPMAHTTDAVRTLTGREPRSLRIFARDHAAVFAD